MNKKEIKNILKQTKNLCKTLRNTKDDERDKFNNFRFYYNTKKKTVTMLNTSYILTKYGQELETNKDEITLTTKQVDLYYNNETNYQYYLRVRKAILHKLKYKI